ncbi:MAG: hypothetical protein CM1200mP1_01700 [Candidatus Neomarinimicrobiota bacterium]|nr:MAG: hypothetical protein CM1200mP1_01700 [Candidatus Neomarinimicrobiota bacterium]
MKSKNMIQSYERSLLKDLGELGLLGIDIPEKFGGIDLDKITTAIQQKR